MMAPSLCSEINDLQELLMGELVPPSQGSLSYPCELTEDGWVNAASGKPLAVRVPTGSPKPGKRIGSDQDQQNGEGPRPYMQPTNLKAIAREAALRGDTKTLFHALDLLERLMPIATFMDFCTELEELRLQGARPRPH
jgi:hypothetical protein